MKTSIKKNYFYNLIYQIFLLIVPIVVTPYVSRILTPEGTGQYSFSLSITTYFLLFANLGFNYYGQRKIAEFQNDKQKQTSLFYEIIICRSISVLLSLIIYFCLILFHVFADRYYIILLILSINVFSVLFDVSFFFQGNEEFNKIVFRNVLIKVLSIVTIFVFVKTKDDLWKYTFIQSISIFCANVLLIPYLKNKITKISFREIHPLIHLKPTLILFIPTIAISVYTVLDKTLIGLLVDGNITYIENGIEIIKKKSDIENGNYEYSEHLVKMFLTVLTSLGTVMIAHNSNKIASNDLDGVVKNVYNACRFDFFLGLPLTFGIIIISGNLVPWYLGNGYEISIVLLKILAPLVIIMGLGNVFALQFLIPMKKDISFTISVIVGAVINLFLNILLIPKLGSVGAAIGTIVGEGVVTISCYIFSSKYFKISEILKTSWKYFISSIVMFAICFPISFYFPSSPLYTVILAVIGATIYFILLFILRDKLITSILADFYSKFKRRKKHENIEKN